MIKVIKDIIQDFKKEHTILRMWFIFIFIIDLVALIRIFYGLIIIII